MYGGELLLRWTFSAERYQPAAIEALAQDYLSQLQALIAHCLSDGSGGLTPSDFPLADLDQAQLDALPVAATHIEDVYPLTPMQEGMLLHTLLEPGTGLYYMQDRYRINSALDPERFARAAGGDRPPRSAACLVLLGHWRNHAAGHPQAGQHAD